LAYIDRLGRYRSRIIHINRNIRSWAASSKSSRRTVTANQGTRHPLKPTNELQLPELANRALALCLRTEKRCAVASEAPKGFTCAEGQSVLYRAQFTPFLSPSASTTPTKGDGACSSTSQRTPFSPGASLFAAKRPASVALDIAQLLRTTTPWLSERPSPSKRGCTLFVHYLFCFKVLRGWRSGQKQRMVVW
jgi:hypothetical protein